MIKKVCTFHHKEIITPEDDVAHQGPMCIIYTTGGGLGAIEPVNPSTNRAAMEPINYQEGVILPFETEAEKQARKKGMGVPNPAANPK